VTTRRLAWIALSGLFLIALGTWIAGEQTEVAVLRTFDDAGAAYETKMWIADVDGRPYVRIGRAGRSWGERLKTHPDVELVRQGATIPCSAAVVTDGAIHHAVDEAFAVKYGWVDWWYGVVLRRDPVPVRLDPRR
jgi:hypothetical protein